MIMTDDNDQKKLTARLRDISLRQALIASGALRVGSDNCLLDENGCKPLAKYRTSAMDDAARDVDRDGDDR
jgi:hypothetical protein